MQNIDALSSTTYRTEGSHVIQLEDGICNLPHVATQKTVAVLLTFAKLGSSEVAEVPSHVRLMECEDFRFGQRRA